MTLALALLLDSLKIVKPVPMVAKDFFSLIGSRPNNLAKVAASTEEARS